MVTRIPLKYRWCMNCTYFLKGRTGVRPYCRYLGKTLYSSGAQMGCLAFTVEKQVRPVGRIDDPPIGRNINKETYTYNSDGDFDVVSYFQDDVLLFTLTYSYDATKRITQKLRAEPKLSEDDLE